MIKVRTRDFIHSTDDLYFASTNYLHPDNRIICFLRYIPDPNGDREKNGKRYSKVNSEEAYKYLRENYPEYLYYSEVTNVEMMGVPIEKVDEIIRPENRLKEIREGKDTKVSDETRNKLIDLSDFFHYIAGIDYENLGISGSTCPGLQKTESSDLDFVVYGLENHRKAVNTFKKYHDQEVEVGEGDSKRKIVLNPIQNQFWERLYHKRIKDDSLSKEEFCWYESRKFNRGVIRGTLFDILCTRNFDEIEGKWEDTIYEPQGVAKVECTISNALEFMDNPAVYDIKDVKVLEGPNVKISKLASFTHTYAGEVFENEHAVARGKLEKVITKGEKPKYRILVGSTRESLGEYIKLKESPV
ncbi:MAG: DNA polymerase subunit beta [Methanobrevibacter wolinii]|nr:DNA polymerase subunit beta [Methanobrevibacter wolinii]